MPTWSALVQGLLSSHLQATGAYDAKTSGEMARHLMSELYQIPTATVLDALLRDRLGTNFKAARNESIRELLYATHETFRAPSLAEDVLLLAQALKAAGKDVHLVTTNYDDLLEWVALARDDILEAFVRYGFSLVPYFRSTPQGNVPGEIPVVHVHGYLPRDEPSVGSAVLSEPDYVEWESSAPFRAYLNSRFASSTVLFIGSSLRDTNIVARTASYSDSSRYKRWAVQAAQGDVQRLPSDLINKWAEIANFVTYRASEMNISLLRPDFYGQVPQFLAEVAQSLRRAEAYKPYMLRLQEWSDSWYSDVYVSQDARERATRSGRDVVAQVVAHLDEVDNAKIELWIRRPHPERSLELWASSQSLWLPGDDYWPRRISLSARMEDHAALHAFAKQARTRGRVTVDPNRWTHYFAVPLVLTGEAGERLPVGSVVLVLRSPKHAHHDDIPALKPRFEKLSKDLSDFGRGFILAP